MLTKKQMQEIQDLKLRGYSISEISTTTKLGENHLHCQRSARRLDVI